MKGTSFWLKLCLCLVLGTTGTGFSCHTLIEKRQTKFGITCEVPATEGTVYSVHQTESISNLSAGSMVDSNTSVEVNCEKGFHKNASNTVSTVCSTEGIWMPTVEKLCLKTCPAVISDNLDVNCTFSGKNVDCSKPSVLGTVLIPRCKVTHTIPNEQVETPIRLHCQQDGKWSGQLYTCIPLCGNTYVANKTIDEGGKTAKYGSAPWNVAVYKKIRKNNFELICAGTLISQNLVVSAAHCFWHDGMTERTLHINDSMYKVGVGKYERDITTMDNKFTQIVDVKNVYLRDRYYGSSGSYAHDIAIILLPTKITVSDAVMPACMDWSLKYSVPNGTFGKIVGWGSTNEMKNSPHLIETNMPYIDFHTCRNMYTNDFLSSIAVDKFCAETQMGQTVEHGSGLTFEHPFNKLHFLTGVVSIKDQYKNDPIAVFTDIKDHITWIYQIYNKFAFANDLTNSSLIILSSTAPALATRSPPVAATQITEILSTISAPQYQTSVPTTPFDNNNMQGQCVIPATEGTVYSLHQPESEQIVILSAGARVDADAIVEMQCDEGYYNKASHKVVNFCSTKGIWIPNVERLCFKTCPPLISDSLDIECTFNGKYVDCSKPSVLGTVLTPRCKATHGVPNGRIDDPYELHCQQNGTWSGRLYSPCIPLCGKPYAANKLKIKDGKPAKYGNSAKYGTAPWNVAVYHKDRNNHFSLRCGGTLISKNLVVSVSRCFFNVDGTKSIIPINYGDYKVGVGKYERDITIVDNEFTQIVEVELIILTGGYSGYSKHFQGDLAIIVLRSEITFSDVVLPVCLDWAQKFNVSNGSFGKIVGWGRMKEISESSVLLSANVSYIDHMMCRNRIDRNDEFQYYVSRDKFCATSKKGQAVNYGDGGAGLTFAHDNSLHYLTGVVSAWDLADRPTILVAYTDVNLYMPWIREVYQRYS